MHKFIIILALALVPVSAAHAANNVPSQKQANQTQAKLKQLQNQMKSLKQNMDSVKGLEGGQLTHLQQMQDLMAKMQAHMNAMLAE